MKTTLRRAALFVAAALAVMAFVGCSGSDDDSSERDVPLVGLMHAGVDHVPGSFPGLIAQLEEEYGWSLPDSEVERCLKHSDERAKARKRASCVLTGDDVQVMWKNIKPADAEWQAKDFLLRGADVIVAYEDSSIKAAQEATAGDGAPTPVVFLHPNDPLRDGLVESLARPNNNLTGVYGPRDVVAKQLELYKRVVGPELRRVLSLVDPKDDKLLPEYQAAAKNLKLDLVIRKASSARDLQRIFRSLRPGEADGAFLLSGSLRLNHSALTIELARRAGLPVQAHRKDWVQQGALFSYGIDLDPIGRAGARYVDALLRGAAPNELTVDEIPTTEFAINLRAAARLGITVPEAMIVRADKVYRVESEA